MPLDQCYKSRVVEDAQSQGGEEKVLMCEETPTRQGTRRLDVVQAASNVSVEFVHVAKGK